MPPREVNLRKLNIEPVFFHELEAPIQFVHLETKSKLDLYQCAENDVGCRFRDLLADRKEHKKRKVEPNTATDATKAVIQDDLPSFSSNNPMIRRIDIGAKGIVDPKNIEITQERARQALAYVRQHAAEALTPEQKMEVLDKAMQHVGYYRPPTYNRDFPSHYVDSLASPKDEKGIPTYCDPYHFTMYSLGVEAGWPVHMVSAPDHVFIRYDDGKRKVDYDSGITHDKDYVAKSKIDKQSIEQGVYLRSLTAEEVEANYHFDKAGALQSKGDVQGALEEYAKAIEKNPNDVNLITNRAMLYQGEGDIKKAMADYDRVLKLDPNDLRALYERGVYRLEDKNPKDALKDLERAQELLIHSDRTSSGNFQGENIGLHIRLNMAEAKRLNGDLRGAKEDLEFIKKYYPEDEFRAQAIIRLGKVNSQILEENKKTTWFRRHVEFGLPELHMGTSITAPYTIRDSSGTEKKQMDSAFLGHLDFFKMGICLASCREKGALYRLGMDDDGMRFMFKLSAAMLTPENGQTAWYGGLAAGMEFYGAFLGVYGRLDMKVVDGFGKRWLMGPEINFKPFKLTKSWPHWLPGGSGIGAYFQTGGGEPDKWVFSLNAFFG